MSDIKPALTPEQWHEALKDRGAFASAMQSEWKSDKPESEHALAALCLIYKPFGFTREEAKLLREVAATWTPMRMMAANALRDLADRIEGMLQPESE